MAARKTRSQSRASKTPKSKRRTPSTKKWSSKVMQQSDAMDLQAGVFKLKSARAVAASLKRSSEASHRRKANPFRSAMSMLNFEINRAGTTLSAERRRVLNGAKQELRRLFGQPSTSAVISYRARRT